LLRNPLILSAVRDDQDEENQNMPETVDKRKQEIRLVGVNLIEILTGSAARHDGSKIYASRITCSLPFPLTPLFGTLTSGTLLNIHNVKFLNDSLSTERGCACERIAKQRVPTHSRFVSRLMRDKVRR